MRRRPGRQRTIWCEEPGAMRARCQTRDLRHSYADVFRYTRTGCITQSTERGMFACKRRGRGLERYQRAQVTSSSAVSLAPDRVPYGGPRNVRGETIACGELCHRVPFTIMDRLHSTGGSWATTQTQAGHLQSLERKLVGSEH